MGSTMVLGVGWGEWIPGNITLPLDVVGYRIDERTFIVWELDQQRGVTR